MKGMLVKGIRSSSGIVDLLSTTSSKVVVVHVNGRTDDGDAFPKVMAKDRYRKKKDAETSNRPDAREGFPLG